MKNIGVLGVGAMGKGIVKNLVKANYKVFAYDPFLEASKKAEELGAIVKNSPKEVGETTEVVLLSLPSSEAVKNSVAGENGALLGLKENSIICDMSTTDVEIEKELYRLAKSKDIGYLGCPVSGGPAGAENGTMSIMVGGEKEVLDKVRPIFEIIGGNIFHLGDIGAGQTVKVCHNMVLAVTTAVLAESFAAGAKAGVSPKILADVYKVSVANSKTLEIFGDNLVNGTYENTIFALSHMHKDNKLYMKLVEDLNVPSVVSSVVYQLFTSAMSKGLGKNDTAAVAAVIEEMANMKISDAT